MLPGQRRRVLSAGAGIVAIAPGQTKLRQSTGLAGQRLLEARSRRPVRGDHFRKVGSCTRGRSATCTGHHTMSRKCRWWAYRREPRTDLPAAGSRQPAASPRSHEVRLPTLNLGRPAGGILGAEQGHGEGAVDEARVAADASSSLAVLRVAPDEAMPVKARRIPARSFQRHSRGAGSQRPRKSRREATLASTGTTAPARLPRFRR